MTVVCCIPCPGLACFPLAEQPGSWPCSPAAAHCPEPAVAAQSLLDQTAMPLPAVHTNFIRQCYTDNITQTTSRKQCVTAKRMAVTTTQQLLCIVQDLLVPCKACWVRAQCFCLQHTNFIRQCYTDSFTQTMCDSQCECQWLSLSSCCALSRFCGYAETANQHLC